MMLMLNKYVEYIIYEFEKSENFDDENSQYINLKTFLNKGFIIHQNEHLKYHDVLTTVFLLGTTSYIDFESYETFIIKNNLKLL